MVVLLKRKKNTIMEARVPEPFFYYKGITASQRLPYAFTSMY